MKVRWNAGNHVQRSARVQEPYIKAKKGCQERMSRKDVKILSYWIISIPITLFYVFLKQLREEMVRVSPSCFLFGYFFWIFWSVFICWGGSFALLCPSFGCRLFSLIWPAMDFDDHFMALFDHEVKKLRENLAHKVTDSSERRTIIETLKSLNQQFIYASDDSCDEQDSHTHLSGYSNQKSSDESEVQDIPETPSTPQIRDRRNESSIIKTNRKKKLFLESSSDEDDDGDQKLSGHEVNHDTDDETQLYSPQDEREVCSNDGSDEDVQTPSFDHNLNDMSIITTKKKIKMPSFLESSSEDEDFKSYLEGKKNETVNDTGISPTDYTSSNRKNGMSYMIPKHEDEGETTDESVVVKTRSKKKTVIDTSSDDSIGQLSSKKFPKNKSRDTTSVEIPPQRLVFSSSSDDSEDERLWAKIFESERKKIQEKKSAKKKPVKECKQHSIFDVKQPKASRDPLSPQSRITSATATLSALSLSSTVDDKSDVRSFKSFEVSTNKTHTKSPKSSSEQEARSHNFDSPAKAKTPSYFKPTFTSTQIPATELPKTSLSSTALPMLPVTSSKIVLTPFKTPTLHAMGIDFDLEKPLPEKYLSSTGDNKYLDKLFFSLDDFIFKGILKRKGVTVCWSRRLTSCAGNFHGKRATDLTEQEAYMQLSVKLLWNQKSLSCIETLVHEMIHAYIFVMQIKDSSSHGNNFKTWMQRIRRSTGINVTITHDYHDQVNAQKVFVWRCNGICRSMKYFNYGFVKRAMNRPPTSDLKSHTDFCQGKYLPVMKGSTEYLTALGMVFWSHIF